MAYKFKLKVLIQRRPHMRDDNLEYVFMIGTSVLRQIFDDERIDPTVKKVVLYFPERYMNIVEERCLFDRLEHFCPNLESVEIMTQSVHIIQCTPKGSCLIVQSPDEQENGITESSTTGRLWRDNAHGYDFSKLTVV